MAQPARGRGINGMVEYAGPSWPKVITLNDRTKQGRGKQGFRKLIPVIQDAGGLQPARALELPSRGDFLAIEYGSGYAGTVTAGLYVIGHVITGTIGEEAV
jgi:hypothetical protein